LKREEESKVSAKNPARGEATEDEPTLGIVESCQSKEGGEANLIRMWLAQNAELGT